METSSSRTKAVPLLPSLFLELSLSLSLKFLYVLFAPQDIMDARARSSLARTFIFDPASLPKPAPSPSQSRRPDQAVPTSSLSPSSSPATAQPPRSLSSPEFFAARPFLEERGRLAARFLSRQARCQFSLPPSLPVEQRARLFWIEPRHSNARCDDWIGAAPGRRTCSPPPSPSPSSRRPFAPLAGVWLPAAAPLLPLR
ncbi:hypothetical protein TRIUR3_03149 [Triticum urartu]|uniref:Uncharacterized protein n=1 Tax=Triticum urartu TaxID=4572 RepID=M8AEU8_TRIUA|nr:hypothetical protein TRIUR3_03149 [Triticum urartu]